MARKKSPLYHKICAIILLAVVAGVGTYHIVIALSRSEAIESCNASGKAPPGFCQCIADYTYKHVTFSQISHIMKTKNYSTLNEIGCNAAKHCLVFFDRAGKDTTEFKERYENHMIKADNSACFSNSSKQNFPAD